MSDRAAYPTQTLSSYIVSVEQKISLKISWYPFAHEVPLS